LLLADRARNAKPDVGASGGRHDFGPPTVSGCNCSDDRQAEACPSTASALLGSAEALERVRREARREAQTVVRHM
jgi:hypothetical protein